MKELSIEEKAKRYDEALKYAMIYYKDGNEDMKTMMKTCFPVLVEESEDERIRKDIVFYIAAHHKDDGEKARWLAWLEKQGNKDMGISNTTKQKLKDNLDNALEKETPESWNEFLEKQSGQKSTDTCDSSTINGKEFPASEKRDFGYFSESGDKIEPKFHEGQWITNGDYTWKIVDVKPLDYILQSQDGNIVDDTISHVDEQFHSFTMEDAKDGDVLFIGIDGSTCIFKKLEGNLLYSYILSHGKLLVEDSHYYYEASDNVHPATKEQRGTLMKAMNDAGYKWDAEKKELKKIEQKHKSDIVPIFKEGDIIKNKKNGDTVKIKQILSDSYCYSGWDGAATIHSDFLISEQDDWELVEQKPAENSSKNSEESDVVVEESSEYKNGFECGKQYVLKYPEEFNLCKKPAAWSEEDKKMIDTIIETIKMSIEDCDVDDIGTKARFSLEKEREWLKSLKDRVQPKQEWSEEDKKLIDDTCHLINTLASGYGEKVTEPITFSGTQMIASIKDRLSALVDNRPQSTWKPSEKMLEALYRAIPKNVMEISEDEILLDKLYQGLKYGRVLSEK